jgi:hypothetical protein
MLEQSFLAIPELDLSGGLKKGSVFIIARKGQALLRVVTSPTTTTISWEALPRYKTIIKQKQ